MQGVVPFFQLIGCHALLAASVCVAVAVVVVVVVVPWDTSSCENSGWTRTCSACRTRTACLPNFSPSVSPFSCAAEMKYADHSRS